jgi:hypothetical protein
MTKDEGTFSSDRMFAGALGCNAVLRDLTDLSPRASRAHPRIRRLHAHVDPSGLSTDARRRSGHNNDPSLKEYACLEDPWQSDENTSICHGYGPRLL